MSIEKIDALLKKLTEAVPSGNAASLDRSVLIKDISDVVKVAKYALSAIEHDDIDKTLSMLRVCLTNISYFYQHAQEKESLTALQTAVSDIMHSQKSRGDIQVHKSYTA